MFVPAGAAAGALLAIETSAWGLTVAISVELLLPPGGSVGVEVPVAVLVNVLPEVVAGATWATMLNVALAPGASVEILQETVAPVVQVNVGPVVCVSETNVVFGGSVSVQETFTAFEGPALATVMV